MRRLLWSMVLCVGVFAAASVAARSVEVERSSADERQPARAVCVSDVADHAGDGMCGKCGDGYCNPRCGETATSCPADCGATSLSGDTCGRCGDGYCVPGCGETAASCPQDCLGEPS